MRGADWGKYEDDIDELPCSSARVPNSGPSNLL